MAAPLVGPRTTTTLLAGWQPDELRRAARHLREDLRRWHAAADLLDRLGPSSAGWRGVAADAAQRDAAALAAVLRRRGAHLQHLLTVLERAAEAVGAARALLRRAAALAATHGQVLHADGTVQVPPGADPGQAGVVAAWAREALDAATEADRDAAHALESLTRSSADAVRLRALPPASSEPPRVQAWWASLTPAARTSLARGEAARLAALDGVPVLVRDRLNRQVLRQALATAAHDVRRLRRVLERDHGRAPVVGRLLGGTGRRLDRQVALARLALPRALARLRLLRTVESASRTPPGGSARRLLVLDERGSGRAAVVVGDPDRAGHVAVLVPGMGSSVPRSLPALVGAAQRLQATSAAHVQRRDRSGGTAVVAWVGYDAPGALQVASETRAQAGSALLRPTLLGLHARAEAGGRDVHLTLVGHSYGSLTAATALRVPPGLGAGEPTGRPGAVVDELVLLGSPGAGVERATHLDVPPGHVFVAEARGDHVADLGWFGTDPSRRSFGARLLETDGGSDPGTGRPLRPSEGHSDYYDASSESLHNIAWVVAGRPDLATRSR